MADRPVQTEELDALDAEVEALLREDAGLLDRDAVGSTAPSSSPAVPPAQPEPSAAPTDADPTGACDEEEQDEFDAVLDDAAAEPIGALSTDNPGATHNEPASQETLDAEPAPAASATAAAPHQTDPLEEIPLPDVAEADAGETPDALPEPPAEAAEQAPEMETADAPWSASSGDDDFVSIDELDSMLAAEAEQTLTAEEDGLIDEVASELAESDNKPAPAAPAPAASATDGARAEKAAPTERPSAPAARSESEPSPVPAGPSESATAAPADAKPGPARAAIGWIEARSAGLIVRASRPLQERLSDSTLKTVKWVALLTLFNAVGAWTYILLFRAPAEPPPAQTDGRALVENAARATDIDP